LEKQEEGSAITRMNLMARCVVPEIDTDTLFEVAREADQGCPVSNLLRQGLTIELETELLG
jgi:osmotically inducible protein OsmC